ncbi:MAG: hypothetical protein GY769_21975 [bacterium]|nr:hypothetical protein [bacterium]
MKRQRPQARPRFRSLWTLGALIALLGTASPADSTTYVAMLDEDLFDQAEVIAEVTVLQRRPSFGSSSPVTEHFASVSRVLKGDLRWSTIVVRTPGGPAGDRVELFIPGSPRFVEGDRALLFLVRNRDESFSPLHLGLGSFVRRGTGGHALAVRPLQNALLLDKNLKPTINLVRNYDEFVEWLAEPERGGNDPPDYYREREASLGNTASPFTLMEFDDKHVRWFEVDSGEAITWRFRAAESQGTEPQFRAALAAWSLDPVRLTLAGSTDSAAGFDRRDQQNSIIFGDPNGDVAGVYSCTEGGRLASGGWWQEGETGTFEGETYVRLIEADIVVNDGTQCLLRDNQTAAAELFTHELGHTLGIGHSCGDTEEPCGGAIRESATMSSNLHNDGRGAEIRLDDAAALATLYGTVDPPGVESTPDRLTARATRSSVARLRWADNSIDEATFEIWGRSGGRQFELFAAEPANTVTKRLRRLEPGASYEFKVRARINGLPTLFSELAMAAMPEAKPARPKRLKAKALGPISGRLTWKDRSTGETKFLIERKVGSGNWSSWRSAPANATSLEFDDAESGNTYSFRVRAKKKAKRSAFSNIATVTMP